MEVETGCFSSKASFGHSGNECIAQLQMKEAVSDLDQTTYRREAEHQQSLESLQGWSRAHLQLSSQ